MVLLEGEKVLKKQIIITIIISIFIFCSCNKTEDIQKEMSNVFSQQSDTIKLEPLDYQLIYETLNQPLLDINSIDLFHGFTEKQIYEYSEEVKGKFRLILDDTSIFPPELVSMLKEALYNNCNYDSQKQEVIKNKESSYFEIIRTLNADNFKVNLEELYHLFPELYECDKEFKSEYDIYKFISGSENCIDMFHINMTSNEENYIFVYTSGGSNGAIRVVLTKLINNEFITICEFETQNSGFGTVIQYEENFYYIFLQYNYNLKNYDGIRVHKLGLNADTENILIQYLPEKYIWKNIYNTPTSFEDSLTDYIESIKEVITSDEYLENGSANEILVYYGEEIEDADFVLTDDYNQYYKTDFTNIGLPIYIRKSNHIPSDYRSTWYLKAKFYIYDLETNSAMELDNLEINNYSPSGTKLVQMWFKEIEQKVFTFRVYHISDYNYMLDVILLEGDKITEIRTDIFSPYRIFKLTEGQEFITS